MKTIINGVPDHAPAIKTTLPAVNAQPEKYQD
jgi:hypothetical protein